MQAQSELGVSRGPVPSMSLLPICWHGKAVGWSVTPVQMGSASTLEIQKMSPAKSITELLVGLSCPWRFAATSSYPKWVNKALTGVKGPKALPVDTVSAKKSVRLWFSGILRANFYFLSSL